MTSREPDRLCIHDRQFSQDSNAQSDSQYNCNICFSPASDPVVTLCVPHSIIRSPDALTILKVLVTNNDRPVHFFNEAFRGVCALFMLRARAGTVKLPFVQVWPLILLAMPAQMVAATTHMPYVLGLRQRGVFVEFFPLQSSAYNYHG